MSSQAFNFSGVGAQTSSPITVNTGETVRLRVSWSSGYPALSLSITQNGTTDVVPLQAKSGDAIDLPECVAGDSIFIAYEGQTAADAAVGILESILDAASASSSGAALDGTDGTGIAPPAGGVGIRGWLSGIYSKISSVLTIGLNRVLPTVWSAGQQLDARLFSDVEVQIVPTGAATVAFTRSLDGIHSQALSVYDQNGAGPYVTISTSTSIIVTLTGGGYLPFPTTTAAVVLTYRMGA